MSDPHAHCGWCGRAFSGNGWPRKCDGCGKTSWRNPIPVAVVLVPVAAGLLTIRRAIPPKVGELALPGGFVNFGESWQEAGARELFEETGIRIDAGALKEFRVKSAPDGTLLIFAVAPWLEEVPPFTPNDETSEQVVIVRPRELAFPLHTEAAGEWFAAQN